MAIQTIKTTERDIAVDAIGKLPWLRVKYDPRTTECAPLPSPSETSAAYSSCSLTAPTQSCSVIVLEVPAAHRASNPRYGLLDRYRSWCGARQQGLRVLRAQVLLPTAKVYQDPAFRAWLQSQVNPPRFTQTLRENALGDCSERTLYRALRIGAKLSPALDGALDERLSKRAALALTQVSPDDQLAIVAELERAKQSWTESAIRAAIQKRRTGASLPDLLPLRAAAALCRRLLRHRWSAPDRTVGAPVLRDLLTAISDVTDHMTSRQHHPTETDIP